IPPEELIDAAADIGYTGFEFAPREQWRLLRDRELDIVAIRGHQSIASGVNDPTQHDRIEREIVDHLAIAAEWSIPILIRFSGERHGIDDESGAVHAANGLRRVAKAAEDAGVTLAMELLNSKID